MNITPISRRETVKPRVSGEFGNCGISGVLGFVGVVSTGMTLLEGRIFFLFFEQSSRCDILGFRNSGRGFSNNGSKIINVKINVSKLSGTIFGINDSKYYEIQFKNLRKTFSSPTFFYAQSVAILYDDDCPVQWLRG